MREDAIEGLASGRAWTWYVPKEADGGEHRTVRSLLIIECNIISCRQEDVLHLEMKGIIR